MTPTKVLVPELHTRTGRSMRRYAEDLARFLKVPFQVVPPGIEELEADEGTILVDSKCLRSDVTTLVPFDEEWKGARGIGEAMIAIGNGRTSYDVLDEGLPVVKALGLGALFYHTSWPKAGIDSKDPKDHLRGDSREVAACADKLAGELGIEHRFVFELAGDIAEGVIQRAIAEHCQLVIVTRNPNLLKGSFVDQYLELSPIPVLVIGSKEARP